MSGIQNKNILSDTPEDLLLAKLDAGDFDWSLQDRVNLFVSACMVAPDRFVFKLLDRHKDIDINMLSSAKERGLLNAVCKSRFNLSRYLLRNGANPNIQSDNHNTPLIVSIFLQNYNIVKDLIKYKADVNIKGVHGNTALIISLIKHDLRAMDLLLENNADINITNENNMSPLYCAVKDNDLRAVSILLKYNPDPYIIHNISKINAVELAENADNPDLRDAMSEYVSKFNKSNKFTSEFKQEIDIMNKGRNAIKRAKIPVIKNVRKI